MAELEYKFAIPKLTREEFFAELTQITAIRGTWQAEIPRKLTSIYCDTSLGDFAKYNTVLRVRIDRDQLVVCLKGFDQSTQPFRRLELEWYLIPKHREMLDRLDCQLTQQEFWHEIGSLLFGDSTVSNNYQLLRSPEIKEITPMQEVLALIEADVHWVRKVGTNFSRTDYTFACSDFSTVVSFDEGFLFKYTDQQDAQLKCDQIAEIEIELQQGDEKCWEMWVQQVSETLKLQALTQSKYSRALAL